MKRWYESQVYEVGHGFGMNFACHIYIDDNAQLGIDINKAQRLENEIRLATIFARKEDFGQFVVYGKFSRGKLQEVKRVWHRKTPVGKKGLVTLYVADTKLTKKFNEEEYEQLLETLNEHWRGKKSKDITPIYL